METASGPTQCAVCKKDKATSRCIGCLRNFCFNHLGGHRQQLYKQLDEIEQDRNLFEQNFNQQIVDPQSNILIQQVNQWEQESIKKIKQAAQDMRDLVSVHSNDNLTKGKLNRLTEQLKQSREQDSVIETDLQKWKNELQQLRSRIVIKQTEIPLIKKIEVQFPSKYSFLLFLST